MYMSRLLLGFFVPCVVEVPKCTLPRQIIDEVFFFFALYRLSSVSTSWRFCQAFLQEVFFPGIRFRVFEDFLAAVVWHFGSRKGARLKGGDVVAMK